MLIGISGKMGSGKNELADMLSYLLFRDFNGSYSRFKEAQDIRNTFLKYRNFGEAEHVLPNIHSFATNLKKCVADCTGKNLIDLEDRNVKSSEIPWLGISCRKLLQEFGEGIRRTVDENFWVRSLLSQYTDSSNWIISDVRHLNELHAVEDLGGYTIRINRNTNSEDKHISEINLDNYQNFKYVVDNNGTLEDLFNTAKSITTDITK